MPRKPSALASKSSDKPAEFKPQVDVMAHLAAICREYEVDPTHPGQMAYAHVLTAQTFLLEALGAGTLALWMKRAQEEGVSVADVVADIARSTSEIDRLQKQFREGIVNVSRAERVLKRGVLRDFYRAKQVNNEAEQHVPYDADWDEPLESD